MFGLVNCNASHFARLHTGPELFFVRSLVKNWLWPIITFFGVTGNILAIIVLTKRRMIMSSTNNYLVALAIVDIAYLVLTLILNTCHHPCFISTSLAEILITICRPIADFSSNSSVWLTVTFTVERWVAITYPLQSRTWCTVHRSRKIIMSVLCASLICTSPSAFETKLVRVIEVSSLDATNGSKIFISRIRAKPTALSEHRLYHRIYFNFVTFAIIWIPLVLLIIFNAILIVYVHRSRQNERGISDGLKLRRHNRGNQGEQQKTTIMLIAVVIVFTVCQIPQAISLTVASFFPSVSRKDEALIFNNFANCLVAVNASINFLLYCCFSDRFRRTFGSSFAFLSKYCAQFIQPNWTSNTKDTGSLENVSMNMPYHQATYVSHGPLLNSQVSNMSSASFSPEQVQKWSNILSKFKSNGKVVRVPKIDLKNSSLWASTDTGPSSPTTSGFKSPSIIIRPSATIVSVIEEKCPERPTTKVMKQPRGSSMSMYTINRFGPNKTISSQSERVLNDEKKFTAEPIWIERRLSANTIEKLSQRCRSLILRDIYDVTV